MNITEVSIVHHVAIVLLVLWFSVILGWSHPPIFFLAFFYLYKINERYSMRLRKRLQFEERKYANQKRLLSDTESVRWLNHAVEKIWPICMEQIASKKFLMPIIPWFLDKFKPWTARKAVLQRLYLGRTPPMFTDMRVLGQSADDDHLVLELGMSFLSADDMSAIIAVQLRKTLGFGITANMHITSMHIEGKILVGVKFLREWPFLERVRVCFVEPPYFQMTVKPIFGHGVDVTELPGISGWLDKLLDVAFGQTLVEPNMLVIDVTKLVPSPQDGWFTVKEKAPVGYVKLGILEGADMKPSDLNGLADPYVKGQCGPYRFRSKIQKKTLAPKWMEEFKIPISSWEAPNVLELRVFDKDRIFDDTLGDCTVNVNDYKDGQWHDLWLPLQNIKMGRIHISITVLEEDLQKKDPTEDKEMPELMQTVSDERAESQRIEENYRKMLDEYEQIDIEGQDKAGIFLHHPGSGVSQTREYKKGRALQPDTKLQQEYIHTGSPSSSASGSQRSDSTANEENGGRKKAGLRVIKKGLRKVGSVFHKSPRESSPRESNDEVVRVAQTPRSNIQPFDDNFSNKSRELDVVEETHRSDVSQTERPSKGMKGASKSIANKARTLRNAIIKKGTSKPKEDRLSISEDGDGSKRSDLPDDAPVDNPHFIGSSPISTSHKCVETVSQFLNKYLARCATGCLALMLLPPAAEMISSTRPHAYGHYQSLGLALGLAEVLAELVELVGLGVGIHGGVPGDDGTLESSK